MESQAKRARVDELVNGTKLSDGQKQVLLDFGEVGRHVKHHHPSDVAEVKRRFVGLPQGFEHMHRDEGRKGSTGRFLNL